MRYFKRLFGLLLIATSLVTSLNAQKVDSNLRKAAKKGQVEKVQAALQEGGSINSIDKKGRTALMFAAEKGYLETVKFLLDNGANIEVTDSNGESALDKATKKKIKGSLQLGLNRVIALIELTQAQRTNTIDGYVDFISKYPPTWGFGELEDYTEMAQNSLEKLDFQEISKVNTIEAYQDFIERAPKSSYVKSAHAKIDSLESISIYETVEKLFGTVEENEQKRIFTNFFKGYGQHFRFETTAKLMRGIRQELIHRIDKLPKATSDTSFFEYIASFRYVPTSKMCLGYKVLDGERIQLFSEIGNISQLYSDTEMQFESVYLNNNVAKLAALMAAKVCHEKFGELTHKHMVSGGVSGNLSTLFETLQKSSFSVESYQEEAARDVATHQTLRKIYSDMVESLAEVLFASDIRKKTKNYLLRDFVVWARLVEFGTSYIAKFEEIANNDSNAENRENARKIVDEYKDTAKK